MATRKHKPGTFTFVPAALAFDQQIGKPGLQVGLLLAMAANSDSGEIWMSTDTMASWLRKPRSFVIEGLSQLSAGGHVHQKKRPGRPTVYELLFRDPGVEYGAQRPARGDRKTRSGSTPTPDRESRSGSYDHLTETAGHQVAEKPGHHLTDFPGHYHESIEKKDRDDDERAPAREASSSAPNDFSEHGQALLIFDELAGRMGWPQAGRLTSKERKVLTARLLELGGLSGWLQATKKAEGSNYLARTKPGLPFFLNEDNLAQLMRGRYDPDNDPPLTGLAAVRAAMAEWGMEDPIAAGVKMAYWRREAFAEPQPSDPPQEPPAADSSGMTAFDHVLISIGAGETLKAARKQAFAWQEMIQACGFDEQYAHRTVVRECKRAQSEASPRAYVERCIADLVGFDGHKTRFSPQHDSEEEQS